METRLVKVSDLSASDEQAWRMLGARVIEPNPFFEPDFVLLACRHFEGFAKTRLVIVEDDGEFRAVLPLAAVEHPRIPPRATVTTRGQPTAIAALCTPLVDRTCVDRAVGALLDGLSEEAKRGGLPGIVALERLGDDGPVAGSIRRLCRERRLPVFTRETWIRGTVSRAGKWESPLSKKRSKEIARLGRVLTKETGLELSLVDRTLDPSAASEFLDMEASGWKGSGQGSAFARDQTKVAWFREWRDRWAPTGRLHVLALNAGSMSIAMQCFVRAGDGLIFFRMAFDAKYARYAPGASLLASSMEYLLEHTDAQWIDSCADADNKFALEMLPEGRPLATLMIGTGGLLDRSLVSALPAMTRVVAETRRARGRWAGPKGASESTS